MPRIGQFFKLPVAYPLVAPVPGPQIGFWTPCQEQAGSLKSSRICNSSLENVLVDFIQDQRDNPSPGVYNERVSSRSSKLEPVPW